MAAVKAFLLTVLAFAIFGGALLVLQDDAPLPAESTDEPGGALEPSGGGGPSGNATADDETTGNATSPDAATRPSKP